MIGAWKDHNRERLVTRVRQCLTDDRHARLNWHQFVPVAENEQRWHVQPAQRDRRVVVRLESVPLAIANRDIVQQVVRWAAEETAALLVDRTEPSERPPVLQRRS